MDGKRVILAAHRGDRANYPENTIAAFKSALLNRSHNVPNIDVALAENGASEIGAV